MQCRGEATAGRPIRWRLVPVVPLLCLSLSACSASRADDSDGAQPAAGDADASGDVESVVVIGDSITDGSFTEIAGALPQAGYRPLAIDGASGRRTTVSVDGGPTSGVEAVGSAIASGDEPDAWVIALGTNDVPQYASADEYALLIAELMSTLPDGAPVVWVDVYLRDEAERTEAFNTMLHQQLDDRPDTVVAPWTEQATDEGVMSDDGIHPTNDGHAAFAGTIVAGLDELTS